jgi:AraC-like DNA-binding protein
VARGIAAPILLRRAGLAEYNFDDPRLRLPAADQGAFLECAAEATHDPLFGLHLAQRANPRGLGLVFYIASAAKDLGGALALLSRYSRIVNESLRLNLAPRPNGIVVDFDFVGMSKQSMKQNTEFWMGLTLKACREITGRDVRPIRVACARGRNADRREIERFYGCPVEFDAPVDRLAFSNEAISLPLITADPYLLELLRPTGEEAARAYCVAGGGLRAAVEKEVQRLLPYGEAKAATVAKALAVSGRTLSRRLADEGTSFIDVLEQLRRILALQYLNEPGFTLAQISWLLGYESPTSFSHAFKRWTGRPPSAARNERRAPAPVSALSA